MSWGSLIGAILNTIGLGALWVALGKFVEVLTRAFNYSITVVPSFQDAVNGFNIQQTAWTAIMVIILIMIWVNYFINSNNEGNQVV
jgi:hypothetical protein